MILCKYVCIYIYTVITCIQYHTYLHLHVDFSGILSPSVLHFLPGRPLLLWPRGHQRLHRLGVAHHRMMVWGIIPMVGQTSFRIVTYYD